MQPTELSSGMAGNLVDRIVDRALVDRKGAYWPLPQIHRQANERRMEWSLGYGSPGVVLALLEYHAASGDSAIAELIHRAKAWLDSREQAKMFVPGFFVGSAGLWYWQAEMARAFPELAAEQTGQVVTALETMVTASSWERSSGISCGISGTLVGALAVIRDRRSDLHRLLKPWLDELASCAHLSAAGVFWDFPAITVRPPVSFLNGGAGVDYAMAMAWAYAGIGDASLLAGSLDHADGAYDEHINNWPDFENQRLFKDLGVSGLRDLIRSTGRKYVAAATATNNSLAWGSGTSGILLSRAVLADTLGHHPLAGHCLMDCRRAVERISRISAADLAASDGSLENGLAGLALALQTYAGTAAANRFPLERGIVGRITAELQRRPAPVDETDVSLLSGASGVAYALLRLRAEVPTPSCIAPVPSRPAPGGDSLVVGGQLHGVLQRCLPHTARLLGPAAGAGFPVACLSAVQAATRNSRLAHPDSLETKAANYELALHGRLHAVKSFRHHLFRETHRKMLLARSYDAGAIDKILLHRFVLDEDVTLLELDFDPSDHGASVAPMKVRLVRQVGSNGIVDYRLSELGFALLSGFRAPAIAIAVVCDVINRIAAPNVTQRQLAQLALKLEWSFLCAGYLFPRPMGRLASLLTTRRYQRIAHTLFPPGAHGA